MELDALDTKSAEAFEGHIVRKDLVRQFAHQYPVPTYVVEFLLGRYCASIDEKEIEEGLEIVERQLASRSVRAGEEELFKARAREGGSTRIIDIITARLDAKTDSYLATLPSVQIRDARIDPELVSQHERMLTGGFYAELELSYDAIVAEESNGRPFGIASIRPIQLSSRDVLEMLAKGRQLYSTEEWKDFLLRSIGMEPTKLTARQKETIFLRLVPFVERNYNMVELGPRGTGKSHLFQQISPYSHLISGGKATVARMFVNNATGQRGLVSQYDVVCFDEVSGVSFDQKDGVNIMKGYMESGEFSRGRESIRADGGIVLVGNFEVDVEQQQRIGQLFGPLPPEMRNDTAFMDRIHSYIPGWDVPKMSRDLFTDQFGLVSDFWSECMTQLRQQSRVGVLQNRVMFGGALSGRDVTAVQKTVSGLLKLLYPDPDTSISDEDLEWAVRLALEVRRRVKEQQKRIGAAEFRNTQFSYTFVDSGTEIFVGTPELQSDSTIGTDPLPPGEIWTIASPSEGEFSGLFKVEITEGPGSGVRVLNRPTPAPFSESVRTAEQNLYSRSAELVGDRDPRSHEFTIQLRAFDTARNGSQIGVAVALAMCTALLNKHLKAGLVVAGGITLGGSIEPVHDPVSIVELAVEKGASSILMPVSARRQLIDLSDDMATRADDQYYADLRDALLKGMLE